MVWKLSKDNSKSCGSTQPHAVVSKISGNQIIRTSTSANIELGCGGTYQITVKIECVQKTRLVEAGIWLNSLQCIFTYKKWCLYSAIVSPKSYGTPGWVIWTTMIWKINHVVETDQVFAGPQPLLPGESANSHCWIRIATFSQQQFRGFVLTN